MGANRLRRIVQNSSTYLKEQPDFYISLIDKLQELLWDEENFVKIEAWETIIHSLSHIKQEDFEERLEPIIKEIFEKEVIEHEEVLYAMAGLWGELLHQLITNNIKHSLSTHIIEFYEGLLNNENDELRKKAAHNFPFFFTQLYSEENSWGNEQGDEEFKSPISRAKWIEYTKKLAHDQSEDIKLIMVAWFKDIWDKVIQEHQKLGFCKKLLFEFMQDTNDEIMAMIVDKIDIYISMFEHETSIEAWEDIDMGCEEIEETKSMDKTPKG